jgi:hypothetical protein
MRIDGAIVPTTNSVFSLGTTGYRWSDVYMGPGSMHVLGPIGTTGGILGSDNNGILYSTNGFATPFINIGPSISATLSAGSIGGWVIGPTGTQYTSNYDLIAQQKLTTSGVPAGLTGPTYSLIKVNDVNLIAGNGYTTNTGPSFTSVQRNNTYILTSGTDHGITTGSLGASDAGFHVNLRSGTTSDITIYTNGSVVSSTTTHGKIYGAKTGGQGTPSHAATLYWDGTAWYLYN